MKRRDTALRQLADRVGILPEYTEQTGRFVRRTSDATRRMLLSAMGLDAPTEQAARAWLAELDHVERSRILEPARVVKRDDASARLVRVRIPEGGRGGGARVDLQLTEENGDAFRTSAKVRGASATIELPQPPRYGYHTLQARVRAGGREWSAGQSLIVVPSRCITPADVLGAGERVTGIVANLYSVRRERDWGIGDFTTLTELAEWTASRGGEFVGINPLHALWNRGTDVSPYGPVSRLFRNPIYIDVEAVPELEHSDAARAMIAEHGAKIEALRARPFVDYDGVIALKERVLVELHRAFRARAASGGWGARRFAEYERFVKAREPELSRHATWMAIADASGVPDWRAWPEEMRDPSSTAVAAFADTHGDRVDFHRWLQFEIDRQLGAVASRATNLGMRIGLYQDLAVGTSPSGSDTWGDHDLFRWDASVGAPPDQYSTTGQVWGLPPIDPRVLREEGYRYWTLLLRRAFDHAGALRIDHAIGLFRSFWIPEGANGKQGAYVRFPANDLLGILALESTRHNAIVVGEDLGTVPKEVPPALKRWGILSSRILYFEHDRKGFKPAASYPPLALTTINTHDMAPIAGWWEGRDLEHRARTGTLRSSAEVRRARRERARAKRDLLRRLKLDPPKDAKLNGFAATLAGAAHQFLCATPSVLVGQSLDDVIGETDPVNVPGTGQDKYPNWRRKTSITVEALSHRADVDVALSCSRRRAPRAESRASR